MTDPDFTTARGFALGEAATPTALAPIPSRLRPGRPPRHVTLPATEPPEQLHALAAEYAGVAIVGALAAGLIAGFLLPRPSSGSLARKARAGLAMAGEVGLAIAARSLNKATPDDAPAARQAHPLLAGAAGAWLHGAVTLISTVKGILPRK